MAGFSRSTDIFLDVLVRLITLHHRFSSCSFTVFQLFFKTSFNFFNKNIIFNLNLLFQACIFLFWYFEKTRITRYGTCSLLRTGRSFSNFTRFFQIQFRSDDLPQIIVASENIRISDNNLESINYFYVKLRYLQYRRCCYGAR